VHVEVGHLTPMVAMRVLTDLTVALDSVDSPSRSGRIVTAPCSQRRLVS
jgi:hypothetical protein